MDAKYKQKANPPSHTSYKQSAPPAYRPWRAVLAEQAGEEAGRDREAGGWESMRMAFEKRGWKCRVVGSALEPFWWVSSFPLNELDGFDVSRGTTSGKGREECWEATIQDQETATGRRLAKCGNKGADERGEKVKECGAS